MNTPASRQRRSGFTLVELLVAMAVIAVLALLSVKSLSQMRSLAEGAHCANSLRQLGVATSLYLAEHQEKCFDYFEPVPGGRLWYYGFETSASLAAPEGQREIDVTQSPLYPYMLSVGGIEICPSFPYNSLSLWKPKYVGASWGYGFNDCISGSNVLTISHPSQVMLFGDCAQVNNFQAPASAKHPMLEEFYMLDSPANPPFSQRTIHFRHNGQANILFLDGHVEKFSMYPGTQVTALPSANVGRITPVGSSQYLQ